MKRGKTKKVKATKANSKLVTFIVPTGLLKLVDDSVGGSDTDRAKWLREAAREKLDRERGLVVLKTAAS